MHSLHQYYIHNLVHYVVAHKFLCLCFVVVLHSFLVIILLLLFFIHYFSTSALTLPWTIARFLHQFYTFSPAHSRHFHFQPFRDLLSQFYRECYGSEWAFFTHRRFLLYAPSPTFYLRLSRPPWEPAVLP